jgi:hypothetical protein
MAGLNSILKGLGQHEGVRDYRHASKVFVDNNYELAPKQQFLFHVFFELSPTASNMLQPATLKKVEAGILVKNIDLPKFRVDIKKYNAYNKKDFVQTALQYDPISIVLHDDGANVVRDLWRCYLKYYYRDSDYGGSNTLGNQNSVFRNPRYSDTRGTDRWGFTPQASNAEDFFISVKIYSLNQGKYSLYELMNPKIESWDHGRHDVSQGTGLMEHTMRLNYQAVNYSDGYVKAGQVKGFATTRYDKQPSPLSPLGGGTKSITGPGGLVDSANEIGDAFGQGDYLKAGFLALRAGQNFKNFDLKKAATAEIGETINGAIRSGGGGQFSFPVVNTAASLASKVSGAFSKKNEQQASGPQIPPGYVNSNGESLGP